MNMIERVARALYDKHITSPLFDRIRKDEKDMWFDRAKTAIEEMREPTEEMIEIFNDHDWIDRYWEPAIDAALKE